MVGKLSCYLRILIGTASSCGSEVRTIAGHTLGGGGLPACLAHTNRSPGCSLKRPARVLHV